MSLKKTIIIKSFIVNNGELIITDQKNNEYYLITKDGTVNTIIRNKDKEEVGINYLEENDIIVIYGYELKSNKFIIKKIYIETKYKFNSESSDDSDIY